MFDTDLVALLMHCTSLTIPLHNATEQSHTGAIQAPHNKSLAMLLDT